MLFVGKRLGYVNVVSFGDVVRGLFLRVVGDVVGYGGCDDKGFCVVFFEMGFYCFGVVGCFVEVGLDNVILFFFGVVEEFVVCCGVGIVVDVSLCLMI